MLGPSGVPYSSGPSWSDLLALRRLLLALEVKDGQEGTSGSAPTMIWTGGSSAGVGTGGAVSSSTRTTSQVIVDEYEFSGIKNKKLVGEKGLNKYMYGY